MRQELRFEAIKVDTLSGPRWLVPLHLASSVERMGFVRIDPGMQVLQIMWELSLPFASMTTLRHFVDAHLRSDYGPRFAQSDRELLSNVRMALEDGSLVIMGEDAGAVSRAGKEYEEDRLERIFSQWHQGDFLFHGRFCRLIAAHRWWSRFRDSDEYRVLPKQEAAEVLGKMANDPAVPNQVQAAAKEALALLPESGNARKDVGLFLISRLSRASRIGSTGEEALTPQQLKVWARGKQLEQEGELLSLAVHQASHQKFGGFLYRLEVGDDVFEGTLPGTARINHKVQPGQREAFLEVLNPETEEAIATWAIELKPLEPPDTIRGAQIRLANLGFGAAITGSMDLATSAAVRLFQRHFVLPETGSLDDKTVAAIKKAHDNHELRPDGEAPPPLEMAGSDSEAPVGGREERGDHWMNPEDFEDDDEEDDDVVGEED